MYKRLLIGLGISLGLNFLIFAIIVGMAVKNKIPLEDIFPVDLMKVIIEKPKPTPPPTPPPTPKPTPKPEKIKPATAPIEADSDPDSVGTIKSAPVISDPPVPSIVNFTELDSPPKRIKFVRPAYPAIAKRANKEGVVVVKFLITKTGNVTNARVVKSPGGLGFDESALAAVRKWRYETPRMRGHAVNAWCVVPIRFKFKN